MTYLSALIIVSVFLALFSALGFYLSSAVIRPRMFTSRSAWDCDAALGKIDPDKYEAMAKEEVLITSGDGTEIYGIFFPNGTSKKTVIIAHGVTFTLAGSIKYMDIFLKRGFNTLILDSRSHGRSSGKFITFGYYEKNDLSAAVDWLENRFGKGCTVGFHGESMGAAVCIQHAAEDPRASFIIEDASFSDFRKLLAHQLASAHLPRIPFAQITALFCFLRSGMRLSKVSPAASIRSVSIPVMFIHGGADRFVPTSMAEELFAAKKGEKELYIAEGSAHADSFWTHKDEYDRKVGDFLKRIGAV